MTSGYYCAIFPFCGGGKKKDDKKTKAFYDQATTGIPVKSRALSCDPALSVHDNVNHHQYNTRDQHVNT